MKQAMDSVKKFQEHTNVMSQTFLQIQLKALNHGLVMSSLIPFVLTKVMKSNFGETGNDQMAKFL